MVAGDLRAELGSLRPRCPPLDKLKNEDPVNVRREGTYLVVRTLCLRAVPVNVLEAIVDGSDFCRGRYRCRD
jgi:hypothetical protein